MNKYIYALFRSLRVLQHILRKGYFNPAAKKLVGFGDNKKCFILGNGPSLRKEFAKLERILPNEQTFVVNNFARSEYYLAIKPTFYALLDPIFFDKAATFDNGFEIGERSIIDIIIQKTNWPLKVLVSCAGGEFLKDRFKSNSNITVYDFNTYSFETNTKLDYLFYSKFYAAPHIQNVIVGCIFLAINFGFKEIDVLGFDHSWFEEVRVNPQNQVCLVDKHFYDQGKSPEMTPFYKLFGGVYKMHEVLVTHAKMFYGYHVLNKYAKANNVKIYNCTEGSYVDAFERKVL